jgi:hypothetical protein
MALQEGNIEACVVEADGYGGGEDGKAHYSEMPEADEFLATGGGVDVGLVEVIGCEGCGGHDFR